MSMIQVIGIFIGLSLDSFIVMMNKGATIKSLNMKYASVYALVYAVISSCAVLAGYGISYIFVGYLSYRLEMGIACLILFALGFMICMKLLFSGKIEEKVDKSFNVKMCWKLALVTSIDTLLLGVGFGFLNIVMAQALLLSFVITFVTILVALWIGYTQGSKYQRIVGISGGILLIIFSLYFLFNYII